jgi:stress-induced morphogen
MNPVENRIRSKLLTQFEPVHLDVVNESGQHNVPPGSESHFKVVLVSEAFSGKRQVQRHQAIYGILADELANGVHALALHTYSPDEWSGPTSVPGSPQCLGGGRHS